jgi:hypothetical protein
LMQGVIKSYHQFKWERQKMLMLLFCWRICNLERQKQCQFQSKV